MDTLYIILGIIGLTHIVVDSSILHPFREAIREIAEKGWKQYRIDRTERKKEKKKEREELKIGRDQVVFAKLHKLINCYQCAGFWVGAFFGLFTHSVDIHWIVRTILGGGVGSYMAIAGAALINYLNVPYPQKNGKA